MGDVVKTVFGKGEETNSSSSGTATKDPWGPQIPYLTYGFEQAKNLYGNAVQNPVYQGNRTADLNQFQTSSANNAGNFSNAGFGYANNAMGVGNNLMNTGSAFGQNAANLFSQYSGDPTQAILNNANAYANSPYAKGMIDAAGRDVTRNLYENQLPTLAKAAAGSGNTNSTRAGVESAIAQRGAADRLADISSNIRGQLFNTGLSQAQNQYNQNLQNSLAANSQLANAFTSGLYGANQGTSMASNLFGLGQGAGQMYQTQEQNKINADMQKFNEQNNNALDLLAKYMNLVRGDYGGTTTSTGTSTSETTKTPSIANILASGFMA